MWVCRGAVTVVVAAPWCLGAPPRPSPGEGQDAPVRSGYRLSVAHAFADAERPSRGIEKSRRRPSFMIGTVA